MDNVVEHNMSIYGKEKAFTWGHWIAFGLVGGHRFYLNNEMGGFRMAMFAMVSAFLAMINPAALLPLILWWLIDGSWLILSMEEENKRLEYKFQREAAS